ncbi:MAG: amino acid ABC transporter ATP-binding protein [Lactococcus sp.]|jgi:polar amino acid transport system ATP-binding protein|uniref:Amino acid ABC transporter ATPase n=2 Tax=Pseudolactococcus TaxID=3436058 RepID=A0A1C3STY5_9LACT|nr:MULTISPECIES: amino acid ABC transporter ATP-binding protein [Lactococcus]MCJ1989535.1 amino acid ABC transporter ATP-binding protein [Lactococcus carnosus]MCJ1991174.1 amino acid ABC transporter ATP-binding protein [Lactococcus carnosus]MCJ1996670.1 amino acid ABC transporter ATP-binding protein [Lactococcus carnosus]MCJ1999706.1 amino acid ABC transporter ATP-binding protein [Lactococcus carnosus]MCJ2002377.1 amino acid ABC transporter ATP-binding protein [Lactococcus carnosus]
MLELKNIAKKFGTKVIFDAFNLTINAGEVVAIAGPSGGGKTTLLRMLAGLESIDAGQVVFDEEVIGLDELITRNLLGFVFQDFQLFPHMTVLENLTLSPVKTMGISKSDAITKAEKLLTDLEVIEQKNAYPFSLSGGQKQRVALARAMMIDPKIIGYDEPTSALDPALRDQVANLILENKALGITQIVVTHDMDFATKIADTIVKVNAKTKD